MKNILFLLICFLFISESALAGRTYVRGHFRSNGTYVAPHYRSSPDSSFYNNWSTFGNINPYTGEFGKKLYPNQYASPSYPKSNITNFDLAPIPSQLKKYRNNG